ncbi:MAG: SURF1 family protein [Actinobacteria bacterium]|nr:SURF1 family protein [Actinomycetota bacterium]
MIRTALQPRWLALLALLLVLLYAFVRLGLWQLSLAQQEEGEDVVALQAQAAEPAVPLEDYLSPHSAFPADGSGRPVRAQGVYVVADQFLVPQRYLEGEEGYWVVTPLQTSADALLPVLRGWVAEPGQADTPDPEPVTVTGTLAPAESPVQGPELPPGQLGSVDLAALANTWSGELYNAFVFATDEQPSVTGNAVTKVPPPSLTREGVDWRNLGYALQWWVFAGFAVFMYLRFLSDAAASARTDDDAAAPHTVAP